MSADEVGWGCCGDGVGVEPPLDRTALVGLRHSAVTGSRSRRPAFTPPPIRLVAGGGSTKVPHMLAADAMDAIRTFMAEREWAQFHTPANLAKSISIEAGELLECFQWSDDADPKRLEAELADVLTYCLLLSDRLGLDPEEIVLAKLQETGHKYPVDKSRGRSAKYDQLPD